MEIVFGMKQHCDMKIQFYIDLKKKNLCLRIIKLCLCCRYQKLWKQFVKFKHLLNSKPKVLFTDKQKLTQKEDQLNDLRLKK